MYTRPSRISSGTPEVFDFISEERGVYDSLLLYRLSDSLIPRENYEIKVSPFRPDLIAEDFYGSAEYLDLVVLQAAIGLQDYRVGTIISLIPKNVLDLIISNVNTN